MSPEQLHHIRQQIDTLATELGFQDVGVCNTDLAEHSQRLQHWLANKYHGSMIYMQAHGSKRHQPDELVPSTLRILSVRMDYTPGDSAATELLQQADKAYIARYALGRDYHKLMRKRLATLAARIRELVRDEYDYRAFVDSAPVMERALAEKAGLGWIGKNTMLLNARAGSWFFLGELFTNLPLPVDPPQLQGHCGSCTACLDVCPTNAFVSPWVLDARRCISYLTIESHDAIPEELRPQMGNRVFGCDDCQLVCPWNKFAQASKEPDFKPRHGLDSPDLLTLFQWSESEFLERTAGSAIRRIGFERWQRNLAVALGNAPPSLAIKQALQQRLQNCSELVAEHCRWALQQQLEA